MPFKSQFKLIIMSLIVLLFIPIPLYFLANNQLSQFMIHFATYFAVVIGLLGISILMIYYLKEKERTKAEINKQALRGYFHIEKIKTKADFTNLPAHKPSKLIVTDNFKTHESDGVMDFYHLKLLTEAKMILNLDIEVEYNDLSFTDSLYIAHLESDTEIYLPQRLSQAVDGSLEAVELKTIQLTYETLASERMRLLYEADYDQVSGYGEDEFGEGVKLYTEYLNGNELRPLN